jgi:tetratricopeptide (TPR) repeat protein
MRRKLFISGVLVFLFFSTSFYASAQTSVSLDVAIQSTTRDIENRLPRGSSLAMVNFISASPALSDYIIEEFTVRLMDSGNLTIIDHNTLNRALVSAEIDIQLSGDVSDDTILSVGKLMGAQYALSGTLGGSGNSPRLEVYLTELKTQRRQSLTPVNVQRDNRLTALMNQKARTEPAIPNNPLTAKEFLDRADAYKERGEYAKAVADYTEVLKSSDFLSRHFIVPFCRGQAYRNLKRYDEAIADYTLAIERNGELGMAFLERGMAFMAIKEFDKALADNNRAVQLTPNLPSPYIIRCSIYTLKREFDKAIADGLYAVKLNPEYANSHRVLCLAYIEKGELEKAEESYRTALRLEPNDETIRNIMGMLCTRYIERGTASGGRGNHIVAIADFTRVIGIDPTSAPGFANRGMGYFNLGELDKAVADLELAVKYWPANAQYKSALERVRRMRDNEAAWR